MNRAEIQKFFLLENHPILFETALSPRSCGGGEEFEQLALYGDEIINIYLYKLISKDWKYEGITPSKDEIHKEPVIKAFADELGIQDILTPVDRTYQPKDRELAETVEALIGAAFEVNGLERCYPIIKMFVLFALKRQKELGERDEFDISQNYKGKLLELIQKRNSNASYAQLNPFHLNKPLIGGAPESRTFQFIGEKTFDVIIDDKKYTKSTRPWSKKIYSEQEAAYLVLLAISGNNQEDTMFDHTRDNIPVTPEKTVHPTTSINSEELIFRKPVSQNKAIKVDKNTGELLVDWVDRKAQKNVFGMLILLSALLDTVSGASWTCKFSSGVLAIINLQLGDEKYFALGFGPSKSKARKAAGEDILRKSDLTEWLKKNYPNHTI